MDYYKDTTPLEFVGDLFDIMKDGDCLSPEKLNADVVDMLGKYLSAQQSAQTVLRQHCGHHAKYLFRLGNGKLICWYCGASR